MLNRFLQNISTYLGITPEEFKRAAIFPLVLLVMVVIGDIIWRSIGLPDVKGTLELIKNLFMDYGYSLVFVSAFVEAFLLIGLYLPGSVALILSATLAGQGVLNIWIVILTIASGMFTAVVINYLLGKYGWYRVLVKFGLKDAIEKMKIRAEVKGIKIIHITYFNPNLASLSATSLGILSINFNKFLTHSLIAFLYWNTIWGLSFYLLGNWIEDYINYKSFIIVIIGFILIRVGYVVIKNKLKVI